MATETSDPATWKWTAADKLFLELIEKAHERDIRVVIDGVFNHTGRDFFAFDDLRKRLATRKITLDVDDAAQTWLANKGYDPVYGARPLKRAIQQQIENPLAQEILEGKFSPGDIIEVGVAEDRLDFQNAA